MEILFATQNANKLSEIRKLIADSSEILGLSDLNFSEELPENGATIHQNSLQKAIYVFELFKKPCFSDDSGLVIDCLHGLPGVHSAHFAGLPRNDDRNIELVLQQMSACTNRKAHFFTVITYTDGETIQQFEGKVDGTIHTVKMGSYGFGYDPIFIPDGYQITFAQMNKEEKNTISHRAKAFRLFINFIHNLKG